PYSKTDSCDWQTSRGSRHSRPHICSDRTSRILCVLLRRNNQATNRGNHRQTHPRAQSIRPATSKAVDERARAHGDIRGCGAGVDVLSYRHQPASRCLAAAPTFVAPQPGPPFWRAFRLVAIAVLLDIDGDTSPVLLDSIIRRAVAVLLDD